MSDEYIEFKDDCIKHLEESIDTAPIFEIDPAGEHSLLLNEEKIDKVKGLKIYIYPDHNPPHFHVRVGSRDYGSYYINNGDLKAGGGVRGYEKNIKVWYNDYGKEPLLKKWHELNPDNRN